MNFDRLVNMALRMFANLAIRAGVRHLSQRRPDAPGASPQDKAQSASARATARRARQAIRIARRLGR